MDFHAVLNRLCSYFSLTIVSLQAAHSGEHQTRTRIITCIREITWQLLAAQLPIQQFLVDVFQTSKDLFP